MYGPRRDPEGFAERVQKILDIFRANADSDGRVVCHPTLKAWLAEKLETDKIAQPETEMHYLRSLRLVQGHNKGRHVPVYQVDKDTSIEEAVALNKRLDDLPVSVVKAFFDSLDGKQLDEATDSENSVIVAEQAKTIVQQAAEIEAMDTLVDKLAEMVKNRRAKEE